MPKIKNSIVIILIIIAGCANAQVNVDAALDTNSILVGDQVDFRIKLQLPKNEPFRWPLLADTLPEKLEIVHKSPIDTTMTADGFMDVEQTLKLTAFDSGYYVIKPLEFKYGKDLSSSVQTEPYLLNVFSVDVDTTKAIKPIKGPISAPLTLAELLPWIIGIIVVIAGVGALIYYMTRKKKNEPVVFRRPKPKLPPHQLALDELEKLKAEKVWQQGRVKEYHSRLTDILREYIEPTYHISAMEMTTWEIVRAFASAKIEQTNLNILRQILEMADFVKFAKHNPLPEENERSMKDAIEFIRRTMPVKENGNQPENNNNKTRPEISEVNQNPVKNKS